MSAVHGSNQYFSWNGVVLHTWADNIQFPRKGETADTTAMGSGIVPKTFIPGPTEGEISVDFVWDGAAGGPDATLAGALNTAQAFEYRANNGAVGVTNPKYTGTAILDQYDITGAVGSKVAAKAHFKITGAITRATS
jgi:hypothetical protein